MTQSIAAHGAGRIIPGVPVIQHVVAFPLCIESKAGQILFPCTAVVWQHAWCVPYLSSLP